MLARPHIVNKVSQGWGGVDAEVALAALRHVVNDASASDLLELAPAHSGSIEQEVNAVGVLHMVAVLLGAAAEAAVDAQAARSIQKDIILLAKKCVALDIPADAIQAVLPSKDFWDTAWS
jgi:hypothetical protein